MAPRVAQYLNPLKMLVVVGSNSGAGNIFSPLNLHKRPLATNLGLKICKFVSCVYCSRCTQGANKYTKTRNWSIARILLKEKTAKHSSSQLLEQKGKLG